MGVGPNTRYKTGSEHRIFTFIVKCILKARIIGRALLEKGRGELKPIDGYLNSSRWCDYKQKTIFWNVVLVKAFCWNLLLYPSFNKLVETISAALAAAQEKSS